MKRTLLFIACLFSICLSTVMASTTLPISPNDMLLQGYGQKIAGNELDFSSPFDYAKRALLVRAQDGTQFIEWNTQEVPNKVSNDYVSFVWIAGESSTQWGKTPSKIEVLINGVPEFVIITSENNSWDKKNNKGISLHFREQAITSGEDRTGLMLLRMPTSLLTKGKPVTIKMKGEKAGVDSWCMTFMTPLKTETASYVKEALYKGGKREVIIDVHHFAHPKQAIIQLGDQKQTVSLNVGKQSFSFMVPEVTKKSKLSYTITCEGEKIVRRSVDIAPLATKWQMNFVLHSHTDIGYTRAQHEILAEHIRFIDYALDYCDLTDNYPDDAKFRWTCEAAWAVSEYLRTRPQSQIDRLKKRIAEGRIEVMAMYFNFDELPDEQSLARSLYPLKEFKEAGIPVVGAMQNDVNGIGWCFNDFFPQMGVKYLTMGTHGHKALICFDKPTVFWWQSPSGNRMLAYRAEHYNMGNALEIEKGNFPRFEMLVFKYLEDLKNLKYPFDIVSAQFSGYFTDNAPPSTVGCDMVRQWNEKYDFPKLRQALPAEFLSEVEKRYANQLETIVGAWPDWWTDGFASGAREAAVTRKAHSDIIANQVGLSLAKILGADVPQSVLSEVDDTNKALLFYGEHTFGSHASISDPFGLATLEQRSHKASYAWESYRRSRPIGETALGLLQPYVNRHPNRSTIAVFNPLNWSYSGEITLYADHQLISHNKIVKIVDEKGREIKMQASSSRADATYWTLWVEDVPALGSMSYQIVITDMPVQRAVTQKQISTNTIQNKWYEISLDINNGSVTKWVDKELDKNLISGNSLWNMGTLIYETDDVRGALDQKRPGNFKRTAPHAMRFEGYTPGPIWDTYRFVGESLAGQGDNNLAVEMHLYNTTKQIRFRYRLNKRQETGPESVYVSFPFELEKGNIFFDVPGATIQAGVDQIIGSSNDWNTVQNFAAVRNDSEQIIMVTPEVPLIQAGNINLGRFKAGAKPESNHIYSWPMTNYWVTNFNADQQGEFEWNYYLTSAADNSIAYATQYAIQHRVPMLARLVPAGISSQERALSGSIISLDNPNLLLVNMTPVPNEQALILHLREIGGKSSAITVSSPYITNLRVIPSNVLGEELSSGLLEIKPWENKFVKVKW